MIKFSGNYKLESLTYWTAYATNNKKLIVFYGQDVLDLTKFATKHPAGERAITSYLLQDIKNILFRVYPHPSYIIQILEKYKCGKNKDYKQNTSQQQHKGICKQKSILTKKVQQYKKVTFGLKYPQEVIKKQVNNLANSEPQKNKKQNQLLMSMKSDQININSQQNKPIILVPYFNVKFECFSKQEKQKKQLLTDDYSLAKTF